MKKFEEVPLAPEQAAMAERYWGPSSRSYNQVYYASVIRRFQAQAWVDTNFKMVKEESAFKEPSNCFHTGKEVYIKNDESPFNQDDIDAIDNISRGQCNEVNGKAGDMKIVFRWECDSGD